MTKEMIKPFEFVKEGEKIQPFTIEDPNSPENKIYVLLLVENDETKSFEIIKGREKTYNFIKDMIEIINPFESKIMVEGMKFDEVGSVYNFLKDMELFFEDGFDIEEYVIGDPDEDIIGLKTTY